nr:helix-hairpin-helix domain-containing protein [Clostridium sporogenes]
MSEVLAFCNKYGIKYNMIAKLIKEYKNPSIVIDKINSNPYVLTEVKGVGFKKADEIAKAVGFDMKSDHRIDSCLRYIISEENANGHSWISRKQLLNRAIELLNIDKKDIENRLDGNAKGVKNVDGDRFTRDVVFEAENYIAQRMIQFKTTSKQLFSREELDSFLDKYCQNNDVELEDNQRQFFYDWNENNILFLVGGGGMGKQFV